MPAVDDLAAFSPFTTVHAAVVIVSAVMMAVLLHLGRRWRRQRPEAERLLRIFGAVGIVVAQLASNVFWMTPPRLDLAMSLPIHVCDLVPWCAAAALLYPIDRAGWARTLTYFWGIGLSSWAFAWPVLTHGPSTLLFWLFWIVHIQIVAAALYIVAVSGWRPTASDWRLACAAVIVYAVLVTPVNLLAPADYGYVGPVDGPARSLGPWPWRAVGIVGGQILIFSLLFLPWMLVPRRNGSPA